MKQLKPLVISSPEGHRRERRGFKSFSPHCYSFADQSQPLLLANGSEENKENQGETQEGDPKRSRKESNFLLSLLLSKIQPC